MSKVLLWSLVPPLAEPLWELPFVPGSKIEMHSKLDESVPASFKSRFPLLKLNKI